MDFTLSPAGGRTPICNRDPVLFLAMGTLMNAVRTVVIYATRTVVIYVVGTVSIYAVGISIAPELPALGLRRAVAMLPVAALPLPDGMSYRYLILPPDNPAMSPPVLHKVRELVEGA